MENEETEAHCSFCVKASSSVAKVIAGPGVYICNECIGRCVRILEEDADPEIMQEPFRWQSMSDQEILDHLPRVATVSEQVESSLATWISRLRSRGVSWARIGAALGMARQSAWERFAENEWRLAGGRRSRPVHAQVAWPEPSRRCSALLRRETLPGRARCA